MTSELTLSTLGRLTILYGGVPIPAPMSRKAIALLVYLAATRRPQRRELLAELLWSEGDSARTRANLSVLLTGVRQQLGSYLQISRQAIAFDYTQPCWLDIAVLEAAIHDSETWPVDNQAISAPELAHLEQALTLYQGDFLADFAVRGSQLFECWVRDEQARLRELVVAAQQRLVAAYLARQDFEAGLLCARALLRLDPFHEPAQRQLLYLLAYTGQRAAALAHYEGYARLLQSELGVAPSQGITLIYRQIREGEIAEQPGAQALAVGEAVPLRRETGRLARLPARPDACIGREAELAIIDARLADPACRLLTLVGPGGVGKTCLAREVAARQHPAFADGVVFVDMAPVGGSADQLMIGLVAAIAASLGLELRAARDPLQQLCAFLHGRSLLLVLDGFEHLVTSAELLGELAVCAPQLRMLVTSRRRLHLKAEWLVDVHGLSCSVAGGPAEGACPAAQLFMHHATRVAAGFSSSHATSPALLQICQLVEGLPLAIELAAAWVRSLSCAQIADAISGDLDLLTTAARDAPVRHRSMRAIFDYSWSLLAPAERLILRRLSVFCGSFTLAAAAAVVADHESEQVAQRAEASPLGLRVDLLNTLAGLVDASLLRHEPAGLYRLGTFTRRFAAERLWDDQAEFMQAHLRYARFVSQM